MKRLIILLCSITALMVGQDAAGQYKLTGVDVLYTYIARTDAGGYNLTVTDAYGFGITQIVANIPQGAPFTSQAMQLTDAALSAVGINLNVTLNEDGTGSVAEGSYYPDVNTIQNEDGTCVTLQQVLPVTDEFIYQSSGSGMADIGMAQPGINVLGIPGISTFAGQQIGLFGLSGSLTFEDFPMIPEHPVLCDPSGQDCYPFTIGDIDGSGTIEIYPDVNLLGIPEYVPGGYPLTGLSGGFFVKRGLNDAGGNLDASLYPGNTVPDFHLEWHGVDGYGSNLGWGDDENVDEDGDGTWWDRLLGIPGITATYLNPACGFNYPVWGDVSAIFPPECVSAVDAAQSGYLMDPTGSLATWGNFLTAHGAIYSQCVGILGAATCAGLGGGILLQDDSGYDVDPSCLSDYDGTPATFTNLLDCAGRLVTNFDIPCVPIMEAREVIAEFIEVGGGVCGTGDMNGDGTNNVLDVVSLVNAVLTGSSDADDLCNGDLNSDGSINVLDVVSLVNCVLAQDCNSSARSATSVEFNVKGNEVTMTANGIVGGIQMTLSHGSDFALTFTDEHAWSLTEGNTTTLIIVNPENNLLFTANGDFTIESVIASDYEGDSQLNTSVNMPKAYSIGSAYPNPFNPTTQMSLYLNTDANVSVKVFNTMGQLVDVITQGQMASGSYNLTWDGTNVASGVYLIQTEVGTDVQTQKIMLIK